MAKLLVRMDWVDIPARDEARLGGGRVSDRAGCCGICGSRDGSWPFPEGRAVLSGASFSVIVWVTQRGREWVYRVKESRVERQGRMESESVWTRDMLGDRRCVFTYGY